MDKHKHSAKTIRLEETDREALLIIRQYYGMTSDNDAVRFALREIRRRILSDPSSQATLKGLGIPPVA
jgi:hypothetical protein